MVKNIIVINKKQTLDLLKYDLEVFPPLIPDGFILFRYNRVVNFHDSNIIREIEGGDSADKEELFELLLNQLKRLQFTCTIIDTNDTIDNDVNKCYKKMKQSVIRKYMNSCPLWALNHETVLKINIPFTTTTRNKQDYIKNLVNLSNTIRVYLLDARTKQHAYR